ncbi:hypothetical protein NECID01_1178 [Nematocida sp. AWRm77]|nr:hypothetical protein NECID01_1178 [Nematocida sp. AWRm77]
MEKHKIEWKWYKVLVVLITFIFTIGVVFISLMPAFEGTFKYKDIYGLTISLANMFRLVEFLFVHRNMQLLVWLVSTLVINTLSFFTMNYTDFMGMLDALDNRKPGE